VTRTQLLAINDRLTIEAKRYGDQAIPGQKDFYTFYTLSSLCTSLGMSFLDAAKITPPEDPYDGK